MPSHAVHPVVSDAILPPVKALSARLKAIEAASAAPTYVQRLVAVLTGFGRVHQRYTVAKLHEFEHYRQTASRWRILWVVLCAPILGFVCALLPVWIPLQNPHLGLVQNPGIIGHYMIVCSLTALGATLIPRAGIRLTPDQFPLSKVALIVVIAILPATGVYTGIALLWRFPVPFTLVFSFVPFCVFMTVSHVVVLRDLLSTSSSVRRPMLMSWPWIIIQASQIVIYPAFSALFEIIGESQQILLTLAFPILKYYIKKVSRVLGTSFQDFNEEMAVTGVEISASLYQSMIIQTSPSMLTTAVIIGVDVVHGVMAVKVFMDKPSVVPHHLIIDTALQYIKKNAVEDEKLRQYTPEVVRRLTRECGTYSNMKSLLGGVSTSTTDMNLPETRETQQRGDLAVIQALEILQAAETILFVEYFEIAIPILNAIYLVIASQPDSARYNPKLAPFHASNDQLVNGVRGILVYSLLQGVTVVVMMVVMRFRYRLSTIRLLSFILERHWWSLQGKMIGWLPLFLHFSLVHYGVDFHFKFEFGANDST